MQYIEEPIVFGTLLFIAYGIMMYYFYKEWKEYR